MPQSKIHVPTPALVAIISLLLLNLAGCATSPGTTMPAMFSASASPASQVKAVGHKDGIASRLDSDADVAAATVADFNTNTFAMNLLTPMFSATCRPDHRLSQHALAIAFVDAHPSPRFDFVPLFKSTSAPGGGAKRPPVNLDLIVDAD